MWRLGAEELLEGEGASDEQRETLIGEASKPPASAVAGRVSGSLRDGRLPDHEGAELDGRRVADHHFHRADLVPRVGI